MIELWNIVTFWDILIALGGWSVLLAVKIWSRKEDERISKERRELNRRYAEFLREEGYDL